MTFVLMLAALLVQEDAVSDAQSLVENGKSLEALQLLQAASRDQPEDPSIHHALGTLYAAAGRSVEALSHVRKAAELAPDDASYAYTYGELLYRAGRYDDAKPVLEKSRDLPEALFLLAAVYEKLGPKEKMFFTLSRYLEMRPDDQGARILLGQQLEAAKRYDEAVATYRGGSPDDPVLLYHAAEVMSRNRETYSESESYARKALEASPEMLEARLLLARLLERTERYEESLRELARLSGIHPDAPQVHYNLARAYQREGRAEDAQAAAALFQELSAKEQERSDREARVAVTYKKAADLLQHGKMLEAEPVFRSVLEIDPEHAQTRSMLAKIAFSKGDLASARRYMADAIERDDDVAEFHYLQALFSLRAGVPADAVVSLQRSLELDPALPDAWSMLGSLLLDSGRAEEALECYLKAAALEPSEATVHLNLASAYAALGNDAEEEAEMERYRELTQR